jgi:hypothetical protein
VNRVSRTDTGTCGAVSAAACRHRFLESVKERIPLSNVKFHEDSSSVLATYIRIKVCSHETNITKNLANAIGNRRAPTRPGESKTVSAVWAIHDALRLSSIQG